MSVQFKGDNDAQFVGFIPDGVSGARWMAGNDSRASADHHAVGVGIKEAKESRLPQVVCS